MNNDMLTTSPASGNVKNQDAVKTINTLAILASGISHEIKNDLVAISFCAELALMNIKKKTESANYVLDALQLQIRSVVNGKPSNDDFKICSISKNIAAVLEQYPFQNNEQQLIAANTVNDFEYIGNSTLTNHILYNLIKNSLRAIN